MSYYLTEAEVQTINQNHQHYYDVYRKGNPAITGAVIYSRIAKVKNDTFYLEVFVNNKFTKTPNETIKIFLNYWLNNNEELKKCKYYKATIFTGKSLDFVALTLTNFEEFINIVSKDFNRQNYKKIDYSMSSIAKPIEWLKRLLYGSKHYPFDTTIYKLFLDIDLQFYDIDLLPFLRVNTYNEDDFYNPNIIGIPTVIRINTDDDDIFKTFPKKVSGEISENPYYAIITFNELNKVYSTKAISNIKLTELNKISFYKSIKQGAVVKKIAVIEKRLKAI
jgi:hypothetical protein